MQLAARPSLEGNSAAKAIGAEPIGRTMKRLFCDGAIAVKGIVKVINDARQSFCNHLANAIGAELIGRMMRRSSSRRSSAMGSSRHEAIVKAIGDVRRSFWEAIVNKAISAIS